MWNQRLTAIVEQAGECFNSDGAEIGLEDDLAGAREILQGITDTQMEWAEEEAQWKADEEQEQQAEEKRQQEAEEQRAHVRDEIEEHRARAEASAVERAEAAACKRSEEVHRQQDESVVKTTVTTMATVAARPEASGATMDDGDVDDIEEVGPGGRRFIRLGALETCTWRDGYTTVDGKVSN